MTLVLTRTITPQFKGGFLFDTSKLSRTETEEFSTLAITSLLNDHRSTQIAPNDLAAHYLAKVFKTKIQPLTCRDSAEIFFNRGNTVSTQMLPLGKLEAKVKGSRLSPPPQNSKAMFINHPRNGADHELTQLAKAKKIPTLYTPQNVFNIDSLVCLLLKDSNTRHDIRNLQNRIKMHIQPDKEIVVRIRQKLKPLKQEVHHDPEADGIWIIRSLMQLTQTLFSADDNQRHTPLHLSTANIIEPKPKGKD